MTGLGWAEKVAPLTTGFVGSAFLLKRPFTALAMVVTPDGGSGVGDLDL